MQESNFSTAIRTPEGEVYKAGIAYIVIPPDVDRDKFVQECYKTNSVSIFSEHNGYTNRVPIDKNSFNFIVFPKYSNEFGSPVSFKVDPVTNCPIVDGVFCGTDELSDLVENQFKFKRKLNNNVVEISGSPDGKYIGLNVISDTKGEVFVNINTLDKSGKFSVNVKGDVVINADNDTTLTQKNKFTCVTMDPVDKEQYSIHEQTPTDESFKNINHNIDSTNVTTNAENVLTQAPHVKYNKVEDFKINDGKEPFILGKKFESYINDLLDEIGSCTTTTLLGEMPILNAAKIVAFKQRTKELLSDIAFIDK